MRESRTFLRNGVRHAYRTADGPAVTCADCARADDGTVANVAPETTEEWSARMVDTYGDHVADAYGAGPVDVAVRATAAILGTSEDEARAHLGRIHRETAVDVAAQDGVAAAYDALPAHDAAADLAWEAFSHETLSQANVLRSLGITWTVTEEDPYTRAAEMFADLRTGGSIRVLSSAVTGGHPLLSDTVNDTFRAVHDILGHAATGRGFDRHGEEAAYQAHAALYSPLARQALATETRGQNASMLRAGGIFPEQKIAALPAWARDVDALKLSRGLLSPEEIDAARADAARDHAAQGLGTWNA